MQAELIVPQRLTDIILFCLASFAEKVRYLVWDASELVFADKHPLTLLIISSVSDIFGVLTGNYNNFSDKPKCIELWGLKSQIESII